MTVSDEPPDLWSPLSEVHDLSRRVALLRALIRCAAGGHRRRAIVRLHAAGHGGTARGTNGEARGLRDGLPHRRGRGDVSQALAALATYAVKVLWEDENYV